MKKDCPIKSYGEMGLTLDRDHVYGKNQVLGHGNRWLPLVEMPSGIIVCVKKLLWSKKFQGYTWARKKTLIGWCFLKGHVYKIRLILLAIVGTIVFHYLGSLYMFVIVRYHPTKQRVWLMSDCQIFKAKLLTSCVFGWKHNSKLPVWFENATTRRLSS